LEETRHETSKAIKNISCAKEEVLKN